MTLSPHVVSTELPTNSFRARPKPSALSSNPTIFLTGRVKKVENAQEVTEHADLRGALNTYPVE